MKKQISYPKIGQFKDVVRAIKRQSTYVRLDENDGAIYDESEVMPIVRFKGTVMLHGTNAAVCFNNEDGIWFQSRNRILSIENDNAGFAQFATPRSELFESMAKFIAEKNGIDLNTSTLSIYGEWAGKGIQKGVGISEIDKAFYIFGVKCTPHDEDINAYWINTEKLGLSNIKSGVFDINGFVSFTLNVDMGNPEAIQNRLIAITEAVEEECPVAKTFGVEGVGEGVVWTAEFEGVVHRFKVKGEKHSSSKVRKLASVDTEKLNGVKSFVEYALTENRFNQALENVFGIGGDTDITKLGDVIRWVIGDIMSEEQDTLLENKLTSKDVNSTIAAGVKKMFMQIN